jgi:uncharacterized membrane protein
MHLRESMQMLLTGSAPPSCRARAAVEIEAPVARVFAHWMRHERLARSLPNVKRVERSGNRVRWYVEIGGREVAWEAQIVELVPDKFVRWESRRGARHHGEVRFDALPGERTHLSVEIAYWPRDFVERLGASLGVVDLRLRRNLEAFRRFIERLPRYPYPTSATSAQRTSPEE